VDRQPLGVIAHPRLVQALAQGVEDVTLDDVTDRDCHRPAGVGDVGATDQAVGGLNGDRAHHVVADVLRHFEGEPLGHALEVDVGLEGVVQLGHLIARELDVDDRPDHAYDAARRTRVGRCCCHHCAHQLSLPAAVSASAPPTISLSSWVISACRAWFA